MRGIYHDGRPGHRRVSGDVPEEGFHFLGGIQHGVVHVDVNDPGAAFYLLRRHLQGFLVLTAGNKARKLAGTGHVGAFANVGEVVFRIHRHGFQPAHFEAFLLFRKRTGQAVFNQCGQSPDVFRRSSATAANDVHMR